MRICLTLIMLVVLAIPSTCLCETGESAEDLPEELIGFVDLDGDGINDNARDRDNDGIPDVFGAGDSDDSDETEAAGVELLITETSADFGMEGVFEPAVGETSAESNFEKFSEHEFATRDLSQDRGGFDAEKRLEGSASRAKICIGGVCF